MKKRALGNTGIEVSEIAFGGVEIGMPYGIGINSKSDMIQEGEAIDLLHSAVDSGINFFDTARLYGQSELIMGEAFKDRRDQVILATKCRHIEGLARSGFEIKKDIERSLFESLEALQTDYIDIFMLHQCSQEILENEDIPLIFSELKRSGIIRASGISTYTPDETYSAISMGAWDIIQLPFNLMDQRQSDLFSYAEEKGVGIVVRSVLLKGLLAGRAKELHPALKSVEKHIDRYNSMILNTPEDLADLATRFALSFKEVSSVLVGIDRAMYLNNALKAANGKHLTPKEMELAVSLAYPDPAFLNLHSWHERGWLL